MLFLFIFPSASWSIELILCCWKRWFNHRLCCSVSVSWGKIWWSCCNCCIWRMPRKRSGRQVTWYVHAAWINRIYSLSIGPVWGHVQQKHITQNYVSWNPESSCIPLLAFASWNIEACCTCGTKKRISCVAFGRNFPDSCWNTIQTWIQTGPLVIGLLQSFPLHMSTLSCSHTHTQSLNTRTREDSTDDQPIKWC